MTCEGKKLLFLGGALYQVPALRRAKELGCYVILADRDTEVPGRAYADEFLAISTADQERILQAALQHKIDGIMTYASDSSVATVAFVAQELGLPGNPPVAAETIRRKDLFREFQREHSLPHPRFARASSLAAAVDAMNDLTFPLVLKPVDSAGTRGHSVIYGRNEVAHAFEKAKNGSQMGIVIIEELINSDMIELDGDIWFKNRQLAFRHYGHNHFVKNRISNVPNGEIFPGFFDLEVEAQLDRQFETIIHELKLRDGCINFDALVAKGTVYIVDVGLRNGGNYVPEVIQLSTGFDLTAAAIHSALGLEYNAPWLKCPTPAPVASYLVGSRFHGRFMGMDFDPELKPFIVEVRPFIEVGDELQPYTRSDLAAGIVFLRFPGMDILRQCMDRIEDLIKLHIAPIRLDAAQKAPTGQHSEFKNFHELISPFLRQKMAEAEKRQDHTVLRVLTREYVESALERKLMAQEGLRHYDAEVTVEWEGVEINGIERLYRRVILFELVQHCAAHCRYCLRRNYDPWNHSREDIMRAARYIGMAPGHEEIREVLVTGGDPGIVPEKVDMFLSALAESAKQIAVVRLATRMPIHQPDLVNERLLKVLEKKRPFRIEIATQINHASEIFPEVEAAYRRLLEVVPCVYNQAVLLKGVNDTAEELIDLCDRVRELGIESHYLFHCVPIGGISSWRTSLAQALELARKVSQSGKISGRAKPKFVLMTSIGKITLYEGVVLDHKDGRCLFHSEYLYEERKRWNPAWELPENAFIDQNGFLCIWYTDTEE
ncbi:MAG: ATP-grasp domain-containing protein [Proteobacteria bacterium]|nr:ATP-grasp domain-containing protein [Pseudomonadota bacterium]